MSLQTQIADRIIDVFSDATIKKIDKDNYLDIHLPSVNEQKGTHIFFNTSKNKVKIGFYCRDNDFVEKAVNSSDELETYSQGIRLASNPTFEDADSAITAALAMINAIQGNESSIIQDSNKESDAMQSLTINEEFIGILNELIKSYKLLPNFSFVPEVLRENGCIIDGNACWFYTEEVQWAENAELWDLLVTHDGFYSSMGQKEFKLLFNWDSLDDLKIKVAEDHSKVTLGLFQENGQFLSLTQEESHSLLVIYYMYQHIVKLIIDEFRDEPIINWSAVDKMGVLRRNFKSYQELYASVE